ncbi:17.6 kDa heat shock protein [Hyaloraphidium curvatum]|nr:17.6 kDa heat shock protein [Hyaloraphidium curvatum]
MTWFMRDPFFEPGLLDPFTMADYMDRRIEEALGGRRTTPAIPAGSRAIEGGEEGQGGDAGQQQVAARTPGAIRNRFLAGRGFKVDVSETPQTYIVRADLPGVDKKDVKIEISDDEDLMTIQAEKREEKREDNESRHVVERSYGSFTRTFRLPENLNVDDCKTSFNNGVLELVFGKKQEEKKEPKRITIE